MGVLEHNLISGLLLMVLMFVLAMSILVVYLVLRLRQREAVLAQYEPALEILPLPRAFSARKDVAFRRVNCWLAIKNRNVQAIQSALALHDARPCSWADGLTGDSQQRLFISPPVSGWVLVIGAALPNPGDDEDLCFRFLRDLSRKLGHVQFFSVSGVLNQHAWVRVETGQVQRAYAWAGRTLWNQGEMTAAERELGMKCYDYLESPDGAPFANPEISLADSERVHLLAARWSLDPDEIDGRMLDQALGIVGEPTRHF